MLSENLKNLRKAKGLSQEELAIKLNVVRQTVSKWEKGLSVPDSEMLIRLAEVLDTSVTVLLGETVEPQENEPKDTEPPITTEEPVIIPEVKRPSASEIEAKTAEYINQYRLAQGDTQTVILPGLTAVAEYRAKQLITNFSHTDSADACTALKYGEFVDMTLYGCDASANYYQGYNREAIAKGNWGGTADEIAQRIATGFKNSSKHWNYVGSSEYGYMAVGAVYDSATSSWYVCICMSSKNYGG